MLHNARARRVPLNARRTSLVITAWLLACAAPATASVDQPTLAATVIDGSSAYSPGELFAVYRDQLGRPLTSASAQAIVAQIEALYLRDGYSRPEFRLGAGLAGEGVLHIEVIEAQLTQVTVSGDPGPYAQKLERLAEKLRGRMPVRGSEVQATLQKMRELPGLKINATTRRDEPRRNSHVLAIEADYQPLEGVVQLTNRGTREIGPVFASGQVVGNNLIGFEERIGLIFSAATELDEYAGGGAFFDVPVSEGGSHLTATTFISRSEPTERPDRDLLYRRERTLVRMTTPVLEGRHKLALSGGIDFDDLEIQFSDLRLRMERLRIAEAGARLTGRGGTRMQYAIGLQLRQGLDGLGSSLDAKDLRNDPRREDFLLTRLQATALMSFAERWSWRIDALGQQSAYVLPDVERYKIGGDRLGRGFEMAEISGDEGIGAKLELRRELTPAAAAIGRTSLYGFYDFGAAWKQDVPGRESAATAGFGFALEQERFGGYLEVAKPLTHADVEGERETKVFAQLRLKL